MIDVSPQKMYYLAKFCRICITTGSKMLDIDNTDYDLIKFSDKLKACTEMVSRTLQTFYDWNE